MHVVRQIVDLDSTSKRVQIQKLSGISKARQTRIQIQPDLLRHRANDEDSRGRMRKRNYGRRARTVGWWRTHHGDILYNKHFRDKTRAGWGKTWCIAHELEGNTDGPGMIILWKEKENVAAGDGERGSRQSKETTAGIGQHGR